MNDTRKQRRDKFAIAALQAIAANEWATDDESWPEVARIAYGLAKAMLEESDAADDAVLADKEKE